MRWSPAALLAAAGACWVDALLGGTVAGSPLTLALVAGIALVVGLRATWPTVLLAGTGAAVLLAVADQVTEAERFSLANDGVFYAVVVLGPALVGIAVAGRFRQVAWLQVQRDVLEERRHTVVLAARAEEAERVTRQVDLALADSLAVIVDAAGDPGRLALVEESSRAALTQLREVLGVLHRPDHPPVASTPVAPSRLRPDRVDALLVLAGVPLAVETAHAGPAVLDVLAALAQGMLLPVVRRRPVVGAVALLLVACLQSALLAPLPPTVSWLIPGLLLAFLVGAARTTSAAVVGLGVTLVGVGLLSVVTPAADRSPDGFVPGLVLGLLAWSGGRVLAGRERRARELRAIAAELARTEQSQARLAAAEQRAELARELHDVGAHALTVACLQAGAARTWWDRDPARAREAVVALEALATGPLAALGQSLADLSQRPQGADLIDVVAGLGRVLGLRVEVVVRGAPRAVADDVAATALRVVQESLTNAARHAAGSTVVVEMSFDVGSLRVRVRDGGATGEQPPATGAGGAGAGLRGMRERVVAVRGELVAGPAETGFEVLATLPT